MLVAEKLLQLAGYLMGLGLGEMIAVAVSEQYDVLARLETTICGVLCFTNIVAGEYETAEAYFGLFLAGIGWIAGFRNSVPTVAGTVVHDAVYIGVDEAEEA